MDTHVSVMVYTIFVVSRGIFIALPPHGDITSTLHPSFPYYSNGGS